MSVTGDWWTRDWISQYYVVIFLDCGWNPIEFERNKVCAFDYFQGEFWMKKIWKKPTVFLLIGLGDTVIVVQFMFWASPNIILVLKKNNLHDHNYFKTNIIFISICSINEGKKSSQYQFENCPSISSIPSLNQGFVKKKKTKGSNPLLMFQWSIK